MSRRKRSEIIVGSGTCRRVALCEAFAAINAHRRRITDNDNIGKQNKCIENTAIRAIKGLGTPSPLKQSEKFVVETALEYPSPDRPGGVFARYMALGWRATSFGHEHSMQKGRGRCGAPLISGPADVLVRWVPLLYSSDGGLPLGIHMNRS